MRRGGTGASYGLALLLLAGAGCEGADRGPGEIQGAGRPPEAVAAERDAQDAARTTLAAVAGSARAAAPRQILFGDLHVHTTYSLDAFFMSLPVVGGSGAHPPADACDFARYCSALDFFALTDHAFGMTPEHWEATKESLRQCQARAGDPADPDLVAFAGWEWTQVGATPETHWGHKNVIFPDLAEDTLPTRVIAAVRPGADASDGSDPESFIGVPGLRYLPWIDPLGARQYADFDWYLRRLNAVPRCAEGVDTRELPADCRESARDPAALFEKLGQWGFDALVIPHGTTWGFYSPPGTSLDKQLTREQNDPDLQTLVEVMSGHGSSEEYRPWRAVRESPEGLVCPAPTPDFLPCCWRAGEIMRERCGDRPPAECETLVEEARMAALDAGVNPRSVFPDTSPEDWLDCDQCRDCFKPSFSYRPRGSVQYALALSNFREPDEDGKPLRFHLGFVASSDNHAARPGTGYKQYARHEMTETTAPRSRFYRFLFQRLRARRLGHVDPDRPHRSEAPRFGLGRSDTERVTSFLYPGGLAAVHSEGRSREAVWAALRRGEVYGTSGPRILLWFDLVNGPFGAQPMGSEAVMTDRPHFEVRAVGSFVQKPGCPAESTAALPAGRLEALCRGECYNPGDERHPILAIEVVRIRPQAVPGEPVDALIEDPWRLFPCSPDPAGCVVRFDDPDFVASGRDALYYVRALQEETQAVNGANLRARYDAEGNAIEVTPCYGDDRTPFDDDCLAVVQERAWSSPIYLDQP